jgi:hypothetical protein
MTSRTCASTCPGCFRGTVIGLFRPPDGFIAKPIDPEEVLKVVGALLGGAGERR